MDKRIAVIAAVIAIAASVTLTLATFDAALNTAPANRPVGLVVNSPVSAPTLDEIGDIYARAASTGAGRSNVYLFWDSLEPERGEFEWRQSDILMSLNNNNNLRVTLYLSIINGNTLGPFPDWVEASDLGSLEHGDITAILDAILERYHIVDHVVLAGQTDEYFRHNEHEIHVYAALFEQVYADLKSRHPGVQFGNMFSLQNVLNKDLGHIVGALDAGDFVAFTYFPVDSLNDIARTPDQARSDLDAALELAGGKRAALFEVGWSTSDFVGGTAEDQRLFVLSVLDFYKTNAEDLEFVTWYRMHDRLDGSCVSADTDGEPASIGGPAGLGGSEHVVQRLDSYLCHSGLISADGTPKPAWDEFAGAQWYDGMQ